MTLPPNQKCPRCGRWSRMFNVRDCSTCKRDGRARAGDAAGELRARRGAPAKPRRREPVESPAVLAARAESVARLAGRVSFDAELFRGIHERWLARQPAGHPWKITGARAPVSKGAATRLGPDAETARAVGEPDDPAEGAPLPPSSSQLTLDVGSSVATVGGEAVT